MNESRRSFFGFLAASPLAALANIPEPEKISRIEPSKNAVYVLEFEGRLTKKQVSDIKEQWGTAFAPNAPKLLILHGGVTLKAL